jgi:hypothetical protein
LSRRQQVALRLLDTTEASASMSTIINPFSTAARRNTKRFVSCGLISARRASSMHAVVVRVNIDDSEAATARLRDEVVPRVSQAQGFAAGYRTRKGNTGLSMLVFESEETATDAEERVRPNMPDAVTRT